jgi:transketolase
MVSKSIEAAEKLAKEGVSCTVLNVSTLKPLKIEEVMKYAKGAKSIVCADEQVKTGGLGEEIASMLLEAGVDVPFANVCIQDRFGQSAHGYEELLVEYGLSTEHVYKAVKGLI